MLTRRSPPSVGLVRQISGREGLRGQDRDEEGDQCGATARPCNDQRLPRVAEARDHDVGGDEAAEDPRRHGGRGEEALHGPKLRARAAPAEELRPHPDQGQLRDDAIDQCREAHERQQHVVLMCAVVRELETRHEDSDDHEGPYQNLHQTSISHAWLPVDAAPKSYKLHMRQSGCHIASRSSDEAQQPSEKLQMAKASHIAPKVLSSFQANVVVARTSGEAGGVNTYSFRCRSVLLPATRQIRTNIGTDTSVVIVAPAAAMGMRIEMSRHGNGTHTHNAQSGGPIPLGHGSEMRITCEELRR